MKRGLVLSGGGAKGSGQWGSIKKLTDLGYTFDVVTGISVGALNGLAVATGTDLTHIYLNLNENLIYNKRSTVGNVFNYAFHKIGITDGRKGWYDNSPLKSTIKKHMNKTFLCDYYCGIVNASTGVYEDFYVERGTKLTDDIIDAVVASAAIPVVFEPIKIQDQYYVDGGVRKNSAIKPALQYDVEEIIVIQTKNREDSWHNKTRNIFEMATSTLIIVMDELFEKDLKEFQLKNRIPEYTHYKAFIIEPYVELGDVMDFSKETSKENMIIGYNSKIKPL